MKLSFSMLLLPLSLAAFGGELFTAATAKASDKKPVALRGVANEFVFPIPDEVELGPIQSAWVLSTANEIECEGSLDGEEKAKATTKLFQLTASESVLKEIEKAKGKPVELKGTIFPAHTRHHRTPFLLEVQSVRAIAP